MLPIILLLQLVSTAVQGWVNVDPVNVRVLGPPFGLPHVGIGTLWNFFGWGYSGDSNWVAKPGSFFSRNINSIVAPGGPYSFGSFWGWPLG